jgi:hypothetical protein
MKKDKFLNNSNLDFKNAGRGLKRKTEHLNIKSLILNKKIKIYY